MNINVDNKTFAIGILSLSAVVLLVAVINKPQPAAAAETVRGRDYTAVTARVGQGDDGLYVLDGKTGLMAVFVYNPGRRQIDLKDVRAVTAAFQGGGAAPPPPRRGAAGNKG
jgi:hypothetical protein